MKKLTHFFYILILAIVGYFAYESPKIQFVIKNLKSKKQQASDYSKY